ncbi:hypothetical protein F4679DRAFT_588633 [Xylaria curta]|nr:hypothetical protein F4679DRAFT_588633 [Xylaria curta]
MPKAHWCLGWCSNCYICSTLSRCSACNASCSPPVVDVSPPWSPFVADPAHVLTPRVTRSQASKAVVARVTYNEAENVDEDNDEVKPQLPRQTLWPRLNKAAAIDEGDEEDHDEEVVIHHLAFWYTCHVVRECQVDEACASQEHFDDVRQSQIRARHFRIFAALRFPLSTAC